MTFIRNLLVVLVEERCDKKKGGKKVFEFGAVVQSAVVKRVTGDDNIIIKACRELRMIQNPR